MVTGKINLNGIKNVILDLGGVILDLDVQATIDAFTGMGFPPLKSTDIILSKYPFFNDYETGKIGSDEFITHVAESSGNRYRKEEIVSAWNAMIRGFRKENINLCLRLKETYRLFLLSNTNAIHEVYYNDQLAEQHGIANLDRIFERVYYSHVLNLRKPGPEIFQFVLADAGIEASESLYVDDTLVHVEAANKLGFRTHHLAAPQQLTEVL
jgi:putative hydrolase of the HAD superfamily